MKNILKSVLLTLALLVPVTGFAMVPFNATFAAHSVCPISRAQVPAAQCSFLDSPIPVKVMTEDELALLLAEDTTHDTPASLKKHVAFTENQMLSSCANATLVGIALGVMLLGVMAGRLIGFDGLI